MDARVLESYFLLCIYILCYKIQEKKLYPKNWPIPICRNWNYFPYYLREWLSCGLFKSSTCREWLAAFLGLKAEIDEASSKNTQCTDDTNSHEDTEQNVVQHHGNKLPLLAGLGREQGQAIKQTSKTHNTPKHAQALASAGAKWILFSQFPWYKFTIIVSKM